MRKNVFFYCTLYMITLCLIMTGCNKNEPEQPAKVQTYHVSIQAGKGDANQQNGPRKALGLNENTLTASWASGERVSVHNLTKNADLGGYLEAQSPGVQTTISGDLTGTINAGDVLQLKFLSPDYTNQRGTLEDIAAYCDYAVATIHVESVTWGSITFVEGIADFENKQAIAKFTLKNKATDAALEASDLVVEVDNRSYNIHPASATSEIFVALPGFTDKTIKLTATVGSDTYTFTSPSAKTFEDGKYYTITVGMSKEEQVVHGFSISPTQQIEFAHGNLQYQPSTGTWRIARNQYDYVGDENSVASNGCTVDADDNILTVSTGIVYEETTKSNNLTVDETNIIMVNSSYDGWVDMFGWNTANNPLNTSMYARDYASKQTDFVDWGHNPIYDPKADITYPADTWRTLSMQEFQYLLFERSKADELVGTASIENHPNGPVKGILILPDDFVMPAGLSFKGVDKTHEYTNTTSPVYTYSETKSFWYMTQEYFNSNNYLFNQNRYTLAQWEQLEAAGAVFLPAAGERHIYQTDPHGRFEYEGAEYVYQGIYQMYVSERAVYWTSTRSGEDDVDYLREAYLLTCTIDKSILTVGGTTMSLQKGNSVRLVRDL